MSQIAPPPPLFLVVDKPPGVTSHDIVAMVRALAGTRKVGHTGTLDPFATGVLPVAIGQATRLISFLDEDHKVYDARLKLGQSTTTGDPEGEVVDEEPVPTLLRETIEQVFGGLVGTRMQVPPMFSAIKVNGRPLYKYARAGETVEVPARPIRVDAVELLSFGADWISFRVTCGRGTYVRVLAEEIAALLGTTGHLVGLRRLASGPFRIASAVTFSTLAAIAVGEAVADPMAVLRPARGTPRAVWQDRSVVASAVRDLALPAAEAFSSWPMVSASPEDAERLRSSGRVPNAKHLPEGTQYRVLFEHTNHLLALAERTAEGGQAIRVISG